MGASSAHVQTNTSTADRYQTHTTSQGFDPETVEHESSPNGYSAGHSRKPSSTRHSPTSTTTPQSQSCAQRRPPPISRSRRRTCTPTTRRRPHRDHRPPQPQATQNDEGHNRTRLRHRPPARTHTMGTQGRHRNRHLLALHRTRRPTRPSTHHTRRAVGPRPQRR